MRSGKFAIGAIAGAATLFGASPAFAHARLVKSDPAANASVAAPKAISLTFDDELVPAFSKAELVMDMKGMPMKVPVKVVFSKDGKTMTATPQAGITPGNYHVEWTAAAAEDGHKMTGEVPFKVR